MTEKTFNRLAAEAKERHKDDPAFYGKEAQPKSSSDAFWAWWNKGIKKESEYHPNQAFFYVGTYKRKGNGVIVQVRRAPD